MFASAATPNSAATMKAKSSMVPGSTSDLRVRLRIRCVRPPRPEDHGAAFGLQDNTSTHHWNLHPGRVLANGDYLFECECRVRPRTGDEAPRFLGPFVHGPAAGRFLYLSWRPTSSHPGNAEPPRPAWVRRMKIHLRTIAWAQIDEAIRSDGVLEAAVQGTGRDGGPNCASVPLLGEGWQVAA